MKLENTYKLFERAIAALLLFGMVLVICIATLSFLRSVSSVAFDLDGGLEYDTFQLLFDRVLAAIIALELAHSVQQVVAGERGFLQVRTVLIIGMLAVVRKLILLEIDSTSGFFLLGLAGAILALGIVFALVSWTETRTDIKKLPSPGSTR